MSLLRNFNDPTLMHIKDLGEEKCNMLLTEIEEATNAKQLSKIMDKYGLPVEDLDTIAHLWHESLCSTIRNILW